MSSKRRAVNLVSLLFLLSSICHFDGIKNKDNGGPPVNGKT